MPHINEYMINHILQYNIVGHVVELDTSSLSDDTRIKHRYHKIVIDSNQIVTPMPIAILRLCHNNTTGQLLDVLYNSVAEGGIVCLDRQYEEFFRNHPYLVSKKQDNNTYFIKPYETRENMIASLIPKNGIYGEIGVFKGEFAKWLTECLKPKKLYLYDLFEGITCSGNADGNNVVNADISTEYENLKRWAPPNVIFFKGDSSLNISIMPDNYFDMIYIDGDHSYEGVKRDINVAFKKVKPGGFIMGHDYEMNMKKAHNYYNFGVDRAVNDFCQLSGQEIFTKALDGCVSFAIKVKK